MQEGGKLVLSVEGPGKASLEKVRLRVWRVYTSGAGQRQSRQRHQVSGGLSVGLGGGEVMRHLELTLGIQALPLQPESAPEGFDTLSQGSCVPRWGTHLWGAVGGGLVIITLRLLPRS